MRLITALCISAAVCLAQESMQMPTPAPEMKELSRLIGVWDVEETHEPSPWMPKGATGKGVATFREGPGGFSVTMQYKTMSGGMPGFEGQGIMTWDPKEKAYKTYWVDKMSPGVMMSSGKKEGETVAYTSEIEMGPQKMTMREVISDHTADSFTSTSYMDGKKVMTLKYKRQAK